MLTLRKAVPSSVQLAFRSSRARWVSTSSVTPSALLNYSEEVRDALSTKKPIVALESTIITHGLPFPTNVDMATNVEKLIRSEGAVPATMAFLNGKAKIGLTSAELEELASKEMAHKISRRDIPYALAHGITGGTTISATMILAHSAGIKVFATGGLGGVHRGVADHWDISADLDELSRTPVAVVCSGPKSILDIPKTVEYLETKGCHLSTYSPTGEQVNVPGFFTSDSGVKSPFYFTSAADAAQTISAGTDFGLTSGYVFCVPVDKSMSLDPNVVNEAIDFALAEAAAQGIIGKATTPFLLQKVWEKTGGDSVKTNVEFVKNNARIAARISRHIAAIEQSLPVEEVKPYATTPQPIEDTLPLASEMKLEEEQGRLTYDSDTGYAPDSTRSIHIPVQLKPQASSNRVLGPSLSASSDVALIGALSQDITCTLDAENISVSSYPGRITTSLGGTAYNVALASAYSGVSTKLVSCVGDREQVEIAKAVSPVIDVSGVRVSPKDRTARYVSTNDAKGELIVACADMDAIYNLDTSFVREQLLLSQPKICVFDGNLGLEQTAEVLNAKKYLDGSDPLIVFEPTSVPKSARLAHQKDLGVFPNASVDIATPNYLELMSMFEEFSFRELFDVHRWFPIIDQLPLSDAITRMKLDIFARSHPSLENVIVSGLVQASLQLLPFIPNLFVTNGPNGVLSFQLIENLRDRTGGVKGGASSVYILSKNRSYGVLIQHFPVTVEVADEDSKSVNGIGDTFCGVLVAQLARSRMWLRDDGPEKKEAVLKAMHASSLSLQTFEAVNSEITTLFEPDS